MIKKVNRTLKTGILTLFGGLSMALPAYADCNVETAVKDATPEEIRQFFDAGDNKDKQVVTFVGYSGAGYEDKAAMLKAAESVLNKLDVAKTIVNIGATPEGIGAIYPLAKEKGFTTTGIVSTQAREYQAALSPCVDYVFYVQDKTWGGYLDGGGQLSPTSSAMVENSDVMIGIGGGEVGRDELTDANKQGKEVRFIAADMNHQKALEKSKKKGKPAPGPEALKGAASTAFPMDKK